MRRKRHGTRELESELCRLRERERESDRDRERQRERARDLACRL